MEVPLSYQREEQVHEEEEEIFGMDLKTRKRSNHHDIEKLHSPTSSDSSITTESNHSETGFDENSATLTAMIFTNNGEKPTILEVGSLDEEVKTQILGLNVDYSEKDSNFEVTNMGQSGRINSSKNEGTNGFSIQQLAESLPKIVERGVDEEVLVESNGTKSLPEIVEGGDEEVHVISNGTKSIPEIVEGVGDEEVHVRSNGTKSLPEIVEGGDGEVQIRSNGNSFSKVPDTAIGLENMESLLDKSSSSVVVTPPDIHTAEQIVNNILKSGQNELPQAEEFDVEGVIMKQETHDLYCPNCNSCITKRVILRRRKRKIQEISIAEEIINSQPDQTPAISDGDSSKIVDPSPGNDIPSVDRVPDDTIPDEPVSAWTCFSCFKIFIPTGNGFLFWRSRVEPNTVLQQVARPPVDISYPEGSSPGEVTAPAGRASTDASEDVGTGKLSPLWILTCCQPAEDVSKRAQLKKPDETVAKSQVNIPHPAGSLPGEAAAPAGRTSADVPEDIGADSPVSPKSEPAPTDNSGTPSSPEEASAVKTSNDASKNEEINFPLWILTCCQPYERIKVGQKGNQDTPVSPGSELPTDTPTSPKHSPVMQLPTDHEPKIPLDDDTQLPIKPKPVVTPVPEPPAVTPEPKFPVTPAPKLPVTPESGNEVIMAISEETVLKPGKFLVIGRDDAPVTGLEQPFLESSPVSKLDKDAGKQVILNMPGERVKPGKLLVNDRDDASVTSLVQPLLEPSPVSKLDNDNGKQVILTITGEEGKPARLVAIDQDDTPAIGVAQHPPEPSPEGPSNRVSGIDIIKAIVYGGLLECITSLSIIASAAGGDATTLNVVALGLANVFGGLIVLFHNLRILKNELPPQHYEEQLGRPGHFTLKATIAVISYLIFGLMAPVVYGFSFRESDDKNFKIITLAAASLMCITILSLAKAHVRLQKGYFTTVIYYLSIGISVSGVGFVLGKLINDALKKLGIFDSRSTMTMPHRLESGAVNVAFSSY